MQLSVAKTTALKALIEAGQERAVWIHVRGPVIACLCFSGGQTLIGKKKMSILSDNLQSREETAHANPQNVRNGGPPVWVGWL
jgi:hypothetical protein